MSRLPYRTELVAYLREEQSRRRRLILVTAAGVSIAEKVQQHLQLFSETIASNGTVNLKGKAKARVLEQKFGRGQFDYAGDSRADLAVWRVARRAVVVSDSKRFIAAVNSIAPVEVAFQKPRERPLRWSKPAARISGRRTFWSLCPCSPSHKITDVHALILGAASPSSLSVFSPPVFISSTICSTSRRIARMQPSGHALWPPGRSRFLSRRRFVLFLSFAGLGIGILCGKIFLAIAVIYLLSNLAYSAWFKRVVMLDVVVLACFYTLRLLAGGAATGIGVSGWLLAFSVFFFFGLAMVKRYSELRELAVQDGATAAGRGYFRTDLEPIGTFGVASGMISVLVLVLYVMSPEVRLLYRHPTSLAPALPALSLLDHAPLVQSQPRRSAAGSGGLRTDRSHELHRGYPGDGRCLRRDCLRRDGCRASSRHWQNARYCKRRPKRKLKPTG